jgi:hypothetical protein
MVTSSLDGRVVSRVFIVCLFFGKLLIEILARLLLKLCILLLLSPLGLLIKDPFGLALLLDNDQGLGHK